MMSDQEDYSELRSWIHELSPVRHYRDSDIYFGIAYRQTKMLPLDNPYENPILIPKDHFEDLIFRSHNCFVNRLSNGDERRLKERVESLPAQLESLSREIENLTHQIEPLEQIQDQFSSLDDRFDTLDEASEADALPDGTRRVSELPDSEVDFDAIYNFDELYEGRWETRALVKGSGSPLRVAANARIPLYDLWSERLSMQKGRAVGQLRLEILRYILAHYEITGFPPERRSRDDVAEETEKAREEADKNEGGRPGNVAPDRDVEERDPILNELLGYPAFWQFEDGEPEKPSYKAIYEFVRKHHPGLFQVQKGAVRKYIERSDIDLEERQEVIENLQQDDDAADKPS